MRKSILAALAVAALAVAAPAALAGNGAGTSTNPGGTGSAGATCQGTTTPSIDTSQVQADITKLDTDIQTRHHDLDADIQALTAAAQSGASADTLKADREKTLSDFQANEAVVKQDRAQVKSDVHALVQAVAKGCGARKAARGQLRSLLQSAEQAIKTELVQFKQENQQFRDAAKAAAKQDRQQHGHGKGSGQGNTGQTTTTNG
ncbi:MAG TPA: hypothetical protein VNC40_08255 [Gaiellaceae bacterium]|nr:hypothetical protein [Gaiellaceae bacterium]